MSQVIIVSNRLPVSVKKEDGQLQFYPSVGGLATGLSSYVDDKRNLWIGWPGIPSDDLTAADRDAIVTELAKSNCLPVFLSQRQLDDFYNGYSNTILWPLFHNLPAQNKDAEKHKRWWERYRGVNQEYADAVLGTAGIGSQIWIHDYQLLLVPAMIRAGRKPANIGFFLHIPFPNVKTYSKLPEARKLLQGMLGADLIGLHTDEYVENFMGSVLATDLGITSERQIVLDDRAIQVSDFPMGIDYKKYALAGRTKLVKDAYKRYRRKYKGLKVIAAVDRLDPSKGLVERLKAYRTLLEQSPKLRGKVVLSMVAAPSRTDIPAYKNLAKRMQTLVTEINEQYGTSRWQPVDYMNYALPFEEVTALFQAADVAFIAPLRDGMNLAAKEFVATKRKNGVLILSETAGAAAELHDALLVNPRQPESLVAGLQEALNMPKRELRRRMRNMQQQLSTNTVQTWAKGFVETLQTPLPGTPRLRVWTLHGHREKQLVDDYRAAERRLLLLDYDGTLVPFTSDYKKASPPPKLSRLIESLSQDPRNTVVLVSGRTAADLQAWFGSLPIYLVAEHGAAIKKAGNKTWQTLEKSQADWQKQVLPILQKYAALTPKARVEVKPHTLVWHYRASPPYYAQKYAVIIKKALKPILKSCGLELFQGNKILEVKNPLINKGTAIERWMRKPYDFALAVGDDYTDEDLFLTLPPNAYTIKVGRGRTAAKFRLPDEDEVVSLLKKLSR